MKAIYSAIAAAWAAIAQPVLAETPVVVELFTSQGCSSCPPADALFHELAVRDDVIALSLHVDYWDYIGWVDEFADPAHSERQRAYATTGGRRSIYTPQMIVNGTTDIVGTRPMALNKAIIEHAMTPAVLELSLEREGEDVVISGSAEGLSEMLVVQMVRYTPLREARISRGENAGRTLSYANVTEGWTVLGEWNAATPLDMRVEAKGDKPVVVLVQKGRSGPIVGAARLR